MGNEVEVMEVPVAEVAPVVKRKVGRPKGTIKPDSVRQRTLRERAERAAAKAAQTEQ